MEREQVEVEPWVAAFDAALRRVRRPGPDPSLRERCLPPDVSPVRRALWGRRVLIVDDEPSIRRLIHLHLSRSGYQVDTARDGLEALDHVRDQRPDLIVLDVMMPGPDGFQVLAALKSDPRTLAIPVIMLTARDDDRHMRRAWQKGADLYLTKPFNPQELRSVVDRFIAALDTPESPAPLRRGQK